MVLLDNAGVGFVSKEELVLLKYFMGDAVRGGRLMGNGRRGWLFRFSCWRRMGRYILDVSSSS